VSHAREFPPPHPRTPLGPTERFPHHRRLPLQAPGKRGTGTRTAQSAAAGSRIEGAGATTSQTCFRASLILLVVEARFLTLLYVLSDDAFVVFGAPSLLCGLSFVVALLLA
jgi:hypothetical protein